MITKKLGDEIFAWDPKAFSGKGYWFVLGKKGGLGRAASKKEAQKLGLPENQEIKEETTQEEPEKQEEQREETSEYAKAAKVRKKGFGESIADKILGGESIGKSIRGTIGDKFKAKVTGIKETFDPLNIAKKLFGRGGAAIAGKMLGRKQSDMEHFAGDGKKRKKDPLLASFASTRITDIKGGDTLPDALSKLYALIKTHLDEEKQNAEIDSNFDKEKEKEADRRNDELIDALLGDKEEKAKPNKEKAEKVEKPKQEAKPGEKAKAEKVSKQPAKEGAKPPKAEPARPAEVPKPSAEAVKPPSIPKPPAAAAEKITTGVAVGAAAAGVAVVGFEFAKAMIKRHEGVRNKPYKDSLGLWTVGVGHLIGDGKSLPPEWNRELSDKEVNDLFDKDFESHKDAATKIPGYEKLNDKGKSALIDLTFNMGPVWYKKWPNFTKNLAAGNVEGAANSLQDSKWYTQVGKRAAEIVALIREGGKPDTATPVEDNKNKSTSKAEIVNEPTQTGSKVESASAQNKQLKSDQKQAQATVIVNTTTNNIKQGDTKNVSKIIPSNDQPAFQQIT
jgi:lysozyme